jgi:hypothetical protein
MKCDETCYMSRTLPTASYPIAYRNRPNAIRKGMFAVIPCSAVYGEWMADQPFWLVKVLRITARHITLQYFGDKFLKTYQPLLNKGGRDSTDTFEIGTLTFYHWFTALVSKTKGGGGKISKGDQKVLSYDVRIAWTLPEHDPNLKARSKPKDKPKRKRSSSSGSSVVDSENDDNSQGGREKKIRFS